MKMILVAALALVGCSSESTDPPAAAPRPQDEAIQNVREIAAAAKAHFDKTGNLCWSARMVPPAITSVMGTAYTPTAEDFNTGDADNGWKCLGWRPSQTAIHYAYSYFKGSGYVAGGVLAGAPDPGPSGFEVDVLGDLDGDAAPSTFALGGRITNGELSMFTVFVDASTE